MPFEFATATRIVFGPGVFKEIGALAAGMGRRALVIANRLDSHRTLIDALAAQGQPLIAWLAGQGVKTTVMVVAAEPTVDVVREGTQLGRGSGCDVVIGLGGGSAMDTAKAVSVLLANRGDPLNYLEVVGQGHPITERAAPCIAIPTTAGTGAEVTANAVLEAPEQRVKASLRSPLMLPRVALVDPLLTLGVPPPLTASTGLDALTQLIEPFTSIRANPLTDALCREGMQRAARSLRRAYEQGDDAAAREDMSLASLFSGMALANAKLGVVHGLASVIGGMFHAPHGAICASLLPHAMAINIRALQARHPTSAALARYDEIARLLTGSQQARGADGVAWVQDLVSALSIPRLGAYGVTAQDFPTLIEKASAASSTKGNPIALTAEEMEEILNRAV